MFCLVTDLLDWEEYPARELAGLYKWRWDGSETGLREAKAPLHGAGPGTGAMLRSGSPELHRPGDRGLGLRDRDDPRRHPRRRPRRRSRPERDAAPGSPSASGTCPWPGPAASSSPRSAPGETGYKALTRQIAEYRTVTRPEPAPRPQVQVPQHVRARQA